MPQKPSHAQRIKLAAPVVKQNPRKQTKTRIDESTSSVSGSNAVLRAELDVVPNTPDAEDDESDSDQDKRPKSERTSDDIKSMRKEAGKKLVNGQSTTRDRADAEAADEEPTSPSFGELLQNHAAVNVSEYFPKEDEKTHLTPYQGNSDVVVASHQSFVTVLTQALRTDDTALLDSCLATKDTSTIRNTIELLDSSLAAVLIESLAARMHRRPGRAGSLMNWVQWTLVVHGGALAAQTAVLECLTSLQTVLNERTKGLNSLLALKGKLDLLEGQVLVRKRMRKASDRGQRQADAEDGEDVIWVEGGLGPGGLRKTGNTSSSFNNPDAEEDMEDDNLPITNGFAGDTEDDEDDSTEADDSASEIAEESMSEDEVEHDEVDESSEDDADSDAEAAAAAPPAKIQKRAR